MGTVCTCGAHLPEGARFCLKCGKPQYELIPADTEPEAPAIPPVAPEPPKIAPIGFQNSVAVRVGAIASGLVTLLLLAPMPQLIALVWQLVLLLAGGFFSVYLYIRRTGQALSVGAGARMGWITGLFCFVIVLVITVSGLAMASNDAMTAFYEQLRTQAASPEIAEQLNEFLSSRSGIAALFMGVIFMMFVLLTMLPAIGGALGAKVLEKE